uniref:EGF-like domain-containing protein n=1 Tax=Angiostrongylus cantonensis TaxID=6313 RepID=A0A0K0DQ06_ANGCA
MHGRRHTTLSVVGNSSNCLHNCDCNAGTCTRTFACSFEERPSGLVLDIKQGISLYDIPTKSYVWQYRFRDLHSSSDDGKVRVQLVFRDERSLDPGKLEVKDIECDEVLAVVFNIHSFLVTKIVAADPDFLKLNPLL